MSPESRRIRSFVLAFTLFALSFQVPGPNLAAPRPPAGALQAVRVLYLQGLSLQEALKLARVEIGIAAVATLHGLDALVVRDLPEQVDRTEAMLRERGAVGHTAEPHTPIVLERPADAPSVVRSYAMSEDRARDALLLLRVLYGIKEVELVEAPPGLRVRDVAPILVAAEELFRELGWATGAGEGTSAP